MSIDWRDLDPNAPKKDPKRQMQGQMNRVVGEHFEQYIKAACEFYKMKDLAYVEKTPEPFKVTGKRTGPYGNGLIFEGHFEKPAQPDFKGTLKGGRSIVFEAKTSQGDRILQSKVTEEQVNALEFHHNLGALCYVFVAMGMRDAFRVPWEVWQNMKSLYGRKYMTFRELEPFTLTQKNGIILLFDGVEL
jgi:recombination protein U